jgi:hypothetical protein
MRWLWYAFLLWLVARDFFDGPADWPDDDDEQDVRFIG